VKEARQVTTVPRDPWRGTPVRHAPAATISACTRLRHSGDWRGACVEAGFHVDIDLGVIMAGYGAAAARRLEADLGELAPDLLWQYLPDEFHVLTTSISVVVLSPLAEPAGTRPTPPALTISLPPEPDLARGPLLAVGDPGTLSKWCTVLPVWCWRADAVTERRDAYTALDRRVGGEVTSLREGRMSPDDLHPLVHDVLYPGRAQVPVVTRWEWPAVRVRCGSGWHEVRIAGGRLTTLAHDDDEVAREWAIGELGGPMPGCVSVLRAWATGRGRLPKRLRWQRGDFFRHARYGHTDDVLAMLDAGFDIAARDGAGATLVHYLGRVDHRRLWPRLRDAGLPLDTRDHEGRTPLNYAVALRNEDVVALLLDVGADPHVADVNGRSPIDWQERNVQLYAADLRGRLGRRVRRSQARHPAERSLPSSILARLRGRPAR
jgi:hypothetical protein